MTKLEINIPKDKDSLIYYGLASFSMLLLLISLIFRLNVAFTPKEDPIVPVNKQLTTSQTKTTDETTTKESTKNSSTTDKTVESSQLVKPPAKPQKKNIIITAQENESESFGGESIKTYTIAKPIEEEGLVATATDAVVAKMTKESMADIGHKGEGLIDINLELINNATHEVTIYPQDVVFTIDDKDYPAVVAADAHNGNLKKGETKEVTLQTVLPKLKNSDAVKEVGFTWKTTTNKVDQEYDVLIVLK